MLDAGAQEPVRSTHDRVVDDEPGGIRLVVELSHPSSQSFGVAGICHDRVDLGSGVSQASQRECRGRLCSGPPESLGSRQSAKRRATAIPRPGPAPTSSRRRLSIEVPVSPADYSGMSLHPFAVNVVGGVLISLAGGGGLASRKSPVAAALSREAVEISGDSGSDGGLGSSASFAVEAH